MQAVILGMLGISELQRRNASPVHICCASALNAKLELDDSAEKETANASTKPAWRIVLVKEAVIFGLLGLAAGRGVLCPLVPRGPGPSCDVGHSGPRL